MNDPRYSEPTSAPMSTAADRDRFIRTEHAAWQESAHGIGRPLYALLATAVGVWAVVSFAGWVS